MVRIATQVPGIGRASLLLSVLLGLFHPVAGRAVDLDACRKTPEEITAEAAPFSLTNDGLTPAVAFLDIGCAMIWRRQLCAMEMTAFDARSVVRDYATGERAPAGKASYVLDAPVATPYGFGVVAFADRADAERFVAARGSGRVLTFDELKGVKLAPRPAGAIDSTPPR